MKQFLFAGLLGLVSPGFAQSVPAHAEGLQEELVSVTLADGKRIDIGEWHFENCRLTLRRRS